MPGLPPAHWQFCLLSLGEKGLENASYPESRVSGLPAEENLSVGLSKVEQC